MENESLLDNLLNFRELKDKYPEVYKAFKQDILNQFEEIEKETERYSNVYLLKFRFEGEFEESLVMKLVEFSDIKHFLFQKHSDNEFNCYLELYEKYVVKDIRNNFKQMDCEVFEINDVQGLSDYRSFVIDPTCSYSVYEYKVNYSKRRPAIINDLFGDKENNS